MTLDRPENPQTGTGPSMSRPFWFRTWIQRFASSSDIERQSQTVEYPGQPIQAVPFLRPESVKPR